MASDWPVRLQMEVEQGNCLKMPDIETRQTVRKSKYGILVYCMLIHSLHHFTHNHILFICQWEGLLTWDTRHVSPQGLCLSLYGELVLHVNMVIKLWFDYWWKQSYLILNVNVTIWFWTVGTACIALFPGHSSHAWNKFGQNLGVHGLGKLQRNTHPVWVRVR